jgi:hypothetical protein
VALNRRLASGSEFPEKWRDSVEIFDGNTWEYSIYDGILYGRLREI